MKTLKALALILTVSLMSATAAQAQYQDPYAYVDQLVAEAGQRAQMHAQNAVMAYRQQTGDWSTPDQQVFAYLDQMARQQNPAFYANLQQREQAFQAQQQAYVANSNAILDGMYNGYMARSNMQHQGHQNYIQQGIWERSNFTNGTYNYELPYYQPGTIYEGADGSTMIQDEYGQYHHYDAGGWHSEMNEYGYR